MNSLLNRTKWCWPAIAAAVLATSCLTVKTAAPGPDLAKISLQDNWTLKPSDELESTGKELSTARYVPVDWYPATVPSTVLAVLVNNGVYPDPNFGVNLRDYPGMDYDIGANFSNFEMSDKSPFRRPWWYRTTFSIPAEVDQKQVWLHFDGINYRAEIWLNGEKIAGSQVVVGTYRRFSFNISHAMRPGEINALAVAVDSPRQGELAVTWVDWNPMPPDKNMGLWDEVYLSITGPVDLRHTQVSSEIDGPSASLTVSTHLTNGTDQPVRGTLTGRIEGIAFSKPVLLDPKESRQIRFTPDQYPQLNLARPRLWWPAELGAQELYELDLTFETTEGLSDQERVTFGIREVTTARTDEGHLVFHVNGKPVLIRGAGYTQDMLLRFSEQRDIDEIRYIRDMNLNAIRLEGKLGNDHLLDLCDRHGVMVLAGWCCCDYWEKWEQWSQENHQVAPESLRDQIRVLRNHPSLIAWLNGSDFPPRADVERKYLDILEQESWPNPILSSATEAPSTVTGPSGVKMNGPYDWVPPSYWLEDKWRGGAFGFNTEAGPGPAIPELQSLKRFLPPDHLWPIDEYWHYHAGGSVFNNLGIFNSALEGRYGPATSAEDYTAKAQLAAYEGIRAMFEAYGRNKYTSTGIIQWMLNDGWPSVIWHLYDYYLKPGGGYFGAKKALEPIHVQYSYDDGSVVVVNSYHREIKELTISTKVYDLDLKERFAEICTIDLPPDSAIRIATVPQLADLTETYFVRLRMTDATGQMASRNLYWLSTEPDELDHSAGTWYYTPTKAYADLTGLSKLPATTIEMSGFTSADGSTGEETATITIKNASAYLAFFLRLEVTKAQDGDEVLPITYEENYFSLWPGEQRTVKAVYRIESRQNQPTAIRVTGYNVSPMSKLLTAQ